MIQTNLEMLLTSLYQLKSEMNVFLEKSIEKKLMQEILKTMNKNLKSSNIIISIAGNIGENCHNIKLFNQLPIIQLKSGSIIVEYKIGIFLNNLKIYTNEKDILQLEPHLKVFHILPKNHYMKIKKIIDISIAELSYTINDEKR